MTINLAQAQTIEKEYEHVMSFSSPQSVQTDAFLMGTQKKVHTFLTRFLSQKEFSQVKQKDQEFREIFEKLEGYMIKKRVENEVYSAIRQELEERCGCFGAPLSEKLVALCLEARKLGVMLEYCDLRGVRLASSKKNEESAPSSATCELLEIAKLFSGIKKINLSNTHLFENPQEIIDVLVNNSATCFSSLYELQLSANNLIFTLQKGPYFNKNTISLHELAQIPSLKKVVIYDSYLSLTDKKEAQKLYPGLEIVDDESLL